MTSDGFKVFRLYDTEQFIVTQVAKDMFEGNQSQAIRHMIREYAKRPITNGAAPDTPPPGHGRGLFVDTPAPYVTREE